MRPQVSIRGTETLHLMGLDGAYSPGVLPGERPAFRGGVLDGSIDNSWNANLEPAGGSWLALYQPHTRVLVISELQNLDVTV